jgi:hypothetical protein
VLQVVVEKTERLVGGNGREPQTQLRQFDRERVLVHAVDAALHHAPLPVHQILFRRAIALQVRIGRQRQSQDLRRVYQKVAAAHRGVQNLQAQDFVREQMPRALDAPFRLVQQWRQRVLHDILDDVLRRIVRARRLALAAIRFEINLSCLAPFYLFRALRDLPCLHPMFTFAVARCDHRLARVARLVFQ